MLNVLFENNLCSKDDLNCMIENGNCTVDDIRKALEGCDTDRCDIVSVIEYACSEQETICSDKPDADCKTTACETDTSKALSIDEQSVTDISTDSNAVSEQTSESSGNCTENDCILICDTDTDCNSVICEDNNCTSETSSDTDCRESDCSTADDCDDSIDSDRLQRDTYSNIYDILKAFELVITTTTTCNSDNGCEENTFQHENTQSDTDTETDSNEAETFEIADYEKEVVRLVNEIRVSYGLSELTLNEDLSAIARLKSEDMRDNHYFSHNSPTFGSPFEMMKHFGINYRTAGENIAMGQKTPQEVVNGWMNSDGHRANILNGSFTEIGVGYAENGHYWTQMFIG